MTATPTIKFRTAASGAKDVIVTWSGLTQPGGANPDGQWVSIPGLVLRAISASGTWGASGSVSLRGSNGDAMQEKTTDAVISGAQPDEATLGSPFTSNGLTFTGMYIATASYRPLVSAGDATTNLTVTAYFVQD